MSEWFTSTGEEAAVRPGVISEVLCELPPKLTQRGEALHGRHSAPATSNERVHGDDLRTFPSLYVGEDVSSRQRRWLGLQAAAAKLEGAFEAFGRDRDRDDFQRLWVNFLAPNSPQRLFSANHQHHQQQQPLPNSSMGLEMMTTDTDAARRGAPGPGPGTGYGGGAIPTLLLSTNGATMADRLDLYGAFASYLREQQPELVIKDLQPGIHAGQEDAALAYQLLVGCKEGVDLRDWLADFCAASGLGRMEEVQEEDEEEEDGVDADKADGPMGRSRTSRRRHAPRKRKAAPKQEMVLSSAYHPQTDGQTERTHRTIEQILRAYVQPLQDNWAAYLPIAEAAYNNTPHASTGTTPFYANYGFHPTTPATLHSPSPATTNPTAADLHRHLRDIHTTIATELTAAKARYTAAANQHRRDLTFKVGDRVRLSTANLTLPDHPSSKLRPRYLGPFTISAVISPVAYRLQLPPTLGRIHPVFHVSRLLPWTDNDPALFPDRPPPPPAVPVALESPYDSADTTITAVRLGYDKQLRPSVVFLVQWSDSRDPSWEPYDAVRRLPAFRAFLDTASWTTFKLSDRYAWFRSKFPDRAPRIVHFVS